VVTIPSEPVTTSTTDPLAPEPKVATPKSTKSTTTHRAASVARPAKAPAPIVKTPVRTAAAAPVTAPAAAPVGPVAAVPPAPPPAAPVVTPIATTPPAPDASLMSNNMLPVAGAAGLGLVVLIGGGLALRRRKRRREDELAADEQAAFDAAPAEPDPLFAEQPAAPAPVVPAPAIAMAAAPVAASTSGEFLPEGAEAAPAGTPTDCADAAPGSHVEAACGGPSADNPSLSIKKRLKRAHFFDQREQLAAAGLAVPVEPDAGLPDALEAPEPVSAAEPATATREPA
jgi:hypothetical protein